MLTPAPHVRWAACDTDNVALLDLDTGTWRMLEGVGARIWAALVLHGSPDGIADEIAMAAGSDRAATRTAVDHYVRQLRDARLLAEAGTRHGARGWRWWR